MKKKKVGIVTFHTPDNYGAVLQAFALQEYITNAFSKNVQIIDFCTAHHENDRNLFAEKSSSKLKTLVYRLFVLLHYYSLRLRKHRFKIFREKYLNLSRHIYKTETDFLQNMEYYDYYVSGSDQVFNPKVMHSNCYYLGFSKGKSIKIAYAPSFGLSQFDSNETGKILKYCQDFDFLSCREKNGADFLTSLLQRNVPSVCDPVFLLSKNEWRQLMVSSNIKEPYILVYDLNGGYPLIELAKKISIANQNIKVICVTTKTRVFYKGVKVVRNVGPRELLGLIDSAKYVVTDSFHGTSLAIILKSKIISYIAVTHTSSRIKSIFTKLNIEDQLVTDIAKFDFSKIKFSDYSNQLLSFISSSKQFLHKCFSEDIISNA